MVVEAGRSGTQQDLDLGEAGRAAPTGIRTVLLVAYHFPPDASSTGRLRTLAFARHLPQTGWQPIVLAPTPSAYERVDAEGQAEIPGGLPVYRSFALDARRHLGWRGKYVSWLATPDRWIWWWPSAVMRGLQLIRRHRVDAIWSTYPIGTAHLVAGTLARLSGLPWIADFRDPVTPSGTRTQQWAAHSLERRTMERATRVVFTTPGAYRRYAERYPLAEARGRLAIVPNGYDEEALSETAPKTTATARPSQKIHLVHSGLLYRDGRNPWPFFEALSRLKQSETIDPGDLCVTLRASGCEDEYRDYLYRLGIEEIVELASPIPYKQALREQADANGLLLFQGPEFNAQIPAKVFEYLRIARPVLALTDDDGDTAELLKNTGGALVTSIVDSEAIASALAEFIGLIRSGDFAPPDKRILQQYTRRACTQRLGQLFDTVMDATQ